MEKETRTTEKFGLIQIRNDIFDIRCQFADIKKELENSHLYKKYKELEKQLQEMENKEEQEKQYIIDYMLANNILSMKIDNFNLKIKNNGRDSVVIENEEIIPQEFFRVKKEIDKLGILKEYRETGVLIPGINILKSEKWVLDVK